ncbi:MAG: ribonuclease HII [Acidobacteriia bacterium]|nr:ribonuclease HII [Terriglobia bacterium]MBV8906971.1 ribonuclease HII [Terriglobia bacterium]MBV9746534.1 ribonuclease HII [Terriglobia bacterium]
MQPEPDHKFRCEAIFEQELHARGFRAVAGVDEVGRGSLFGPVFAAAVILSPNRPVRGLNDSKLLEPERREVLAERIRERAISCAVAAVDAATIDRLNIYHASRLAMRMAVAQLAPAPDFVLIDAVPLDLAIPQRPLIKGDARCHAIAAASILAKVTRDACMRVWDEVFPRYGLASHKGYSTPEHRKAIQEHGPTPLHRLSFEPVRACSYFPVEYNSQMALFETAGAS